MIQNLPPPRAPECRDLPLDALAARIGDELESLAALSAEVQSALSLCIFSEHTDPSAIRGLQGIDRITQALEDLGRLMSAVSTEMPRDVNLHAVPILSRLRLHELVNNLDPSVERTAAVEDEDEGEIQWF
ncbi:hypothetical protein [Phaeovulum vinaykumarii]|uniref:Uncharacterized protein n=1 Tax=Phaeovulum vinaykumarii TaxID=407234 RepID=A0A1N7LJT5_9RHOB|nr:hypothetical protein [Phaeovulum vinaykumarii]SIS74083.1 hypothetical protein SAMN05421795_103137 [Phaeovulum vinaykumarii]SOC04875.1 hypothetical protein SAMN05878426_103137 [Phaeovulum vinaykumarii]